MLHATLTHNFNNYNYTNITFLDVKLNLCNYLNDIIKEYCPVHPGIYYFHISSSTDTVYHYYYNSISQHQYYTVKQLLTMKKESK